MSFGIQFCVVDACARFSVCPARGESVFFFSTVSGGQRKKPCAADSSSLQAAKLQLSNAEHSLKAGELHKVCRAKLAETNGTPALGSGESICKSTAYRRAERRRLARCMVSWEGGLAVVAAGRARPPHDAVEPSSRS